MDVRITGDVLTIFDADEHVATHQIARQRAVYVTDTDHVPVNMADTRGLWTSEYFLREASRIGPATKEVIARVSDCLCAGGLVYK